MFGLFANKAAATDDNMQLNEDGSMTIIPPTIVKIGGHEFVAGEDQATKAFDAWVVKAKASNEMIPTGDDGAHYPINSAQGKAELIKAELQIKHNLTPAEAQKAVNAVSSLKTPGVKPVLIFKKGKPSEDGPDGSETKATAKQAVAKKGTAKASTLRGPKGEIPS